MTVTFLKLASAALLFTMAVAAPVRAASLKQLPFHGTMQSTDTVTLNDFPVLVVESIGTGHATPLGRFTWNLEVHADLAAGTATGTVVLTAANGDRLFTEFTATSAASDIPGTILISEIHTITGGTGRFAGANGSFTREAVSNMDMGITSGVLDGTVVINKTK